MYDVIILGAGGVGTAAAMHAARRGARTLALDRFPLGHDRGSSHGDTRVIRLAYFEHPSYVPLLRRAYELWRELEVASGESLYREVGLLQVGPPAGEVIAGTLASARQHNLEVEVCSAEEIARRWPGFQASDGAIGVLERRAGYLRVERCVLAHAHEAAQLGAEFRTGESIVSWRVEGERAIVTTDRQEYVARRLILAGGAWAGSLLRESGDDGADVVPPLRVLRKHLHWFACEQSDYDETRCPTFLFDLEGSILYGFPRLAGEISLKVALHSGGEEIADPLAIDRRPDQEEQAEIEQGLRRVLPPLAAEGLTQVRHSTCLYTMSPDGHFIVDRHPRHEQVVFAAGLSGHGFKFASVLGETLVQLAFDGGTPLDISFLSRSRFGSREPV